MLRLIVVDISAESRSKLVEQITLFQQLEAQSTSLLPKISVKPLSLEELKFHATPDACLLGPQLIAEDISTVAKIRKLLPDTPILTFLNESQEDLVLIEDLARLGADDTISNTITSLDFFKKIILHCRKSRKTSKGELVLVDSAKGGLGVTSLASAIAEELVRDDKKVALIDFDFETQDLSRFLQAKPFINENLQLLLDGSRPITEEFVEQCLVQVWDEEDLYCMPPCGETEDLYDYHAGYARILISILEVLDEIYDAVVIDVGCARGSILKTLYRVADKVAFVINNDPAALYASISKAGQIKSLMAPNARLVFVENMPAKEGLPTAVLKNELGFALKDENLNWYPLQIPNCNAGHRWPGSGDTLFSRGSKELQRSITGLIGFLGIRDEAEALRAAEAKSFVRNFAKKFVKADRAITGPDQAIKLGDNKKEKTRLLPFAKEKSRVDLEHEAKSTQALFDKLVSESANSTESLEEPETETQVDAEELFQKANVS
ncbi:MAG: AAA family ATPase [Deltaproteobacteria bacterium]|nr:AAA family ATPase [Deltaproteobacteria bacterium]